MRTMVGGLPVAASVLDGFEKRLFGGGAAGAAVAGHVGIGDAEFGAAAGDAGTKFGHVDDGALWLVGHRRDPFRPLKDIAGERG